MTYYFMVAIFVMGMFVGSAHETEDKPGPIQWALLVLISALWPWMAFMIWKEWWDKP